MSARVELVKQFSKTLARITDEIFCCGSLQITPATSGVFGIAERRQIPTSRKKRTHHRVGINSWHFRDHENGGPCRKDEASEPDIHIRPEITDVRTFDTKEKPVYRQAQPTIGELRPLIGKKIRTIRAPYVSLLWSKQGGDTSIPDKMEIQ